MNLNIYISNYGANVFEALYRPVNEPKHKGNPLIEALPPFHLSKDLIGKFGVYPHHHDSESFLPAADRMMAIVRINDYIEPLPVHYNIVDQISLGVRAGYASRNPKDENYRKEQIELYRLAMDGEITSLERSSPSVAPSLALIGDSGVGKSTVVRRSLSFLPQVIIHPNFNLVQISWLKIDCPPNGELKQLLMEIISQVSYLLDTDVISSHGSKSLNELSVAVAKLASQINLGLLVIDEVQNILECAVGKPKLINYLVKLANTVRVPILTIGTPRVLNEFGASFRIARRVSDHGTYVWSRMKFDKIWEHFLHGLFKFQWLKKPVEFNTDLSSTLYKHTMGIHALAVRLFQFCQFETIKNESETLSKKLIIKVAEEKLKLVKPILESIETKKYKYLKQYDDLLTNYYKDLSDEVETEGQMADLQAKSETRRNSSFEIHRTISALMAIGYEQGATQKVVAEMFEKYPDMSCESAVRKILEKLTKPETNALCGKSLMEIVSEGEEGGLDAYEALNRAGLIGRKTLPFLQPTGA